MSRSSALVDEVANELSTWPGVRIQRRSDGAARVMYRQSELGILYPDSGAAEVLFLKPEHDALIEHGEGEPAQLTPGQRPGPGAGVRATSW
ncbi:MAG TPA: luciferase family protein [Solirubrobacteraceae bacterium]